MAFAMPDPTESDDPVPVEKREAYQIALGDLDEYDRKRIAMRMLKDMNRLYEEQDKEDEQA
jgi:hypothetical protein